MSKLIMLSGLPASGKSTQAKTILEQSGNYVRVNKDLLRTMLHFDKWTGRNEEMTQKAEVELAEYFLKKDMNVVVDDTNLSEKHKIQWQTIADFNQATFEHVNIDTPVEECVRRDHYRGQKAVGKYVIRNMALQYGLSDIKGKIVLCDIDGTIADCSHRKHFVESEPKDWKGFFGAMGDDSVRENVKEMLDQFNSEGYTIIFVTARPEDYKLHTEFWLYQHEIHNFYSIIMRRKNDTRPDTEVKKQMLDTYFPDKSIIHKVIDDRPSVIRIWRENGLDVIDVGDGKEF